MSKTAARGEATGLLGFQDALRHWQQEIAEILHDHYGELRRRGHDVEIIGALDETVGHAGCIVREANGILKGGWDPRSDGAVVAY